MSGDYSCNFKLDIAIAKPDIRNILQNFRMMLQTFTLEEISSLD